MRKKRTRIVCSSLPFSGHVNPLLTIAGSLESREENDVFLVMLPSGVDGIRDRCKACGIQIVELSMDDKTFDHKVVLKSTVINGKVPFPDAADHMKKPMEEALDKIQPDVLLSDFCCFASQEYATTRNIPLVINWPGPMNSVWDMLRPVINANSRHFYFCAGGLFVSYVQFSVFRALVYANVSDLGRFANRMTKSINCGNSMVLVHSFWGLEKPHYFLHRNIVPVGIIEKQVSSTDFSESHPELHTFLEDSRKNQRKILLVTTGSVILMDQWMVQLLWKAFAQLSNGNVSILWSLKQERQDFLSQEQLQHPSFHFSTWLPQPALLAGQDIDGVFTHCGWGGTSECLLGGKPVVVLPFFVDQMTNAKLLLEAGCATSVTKIPSFNTDPTGRSSYTKATNEDLGWLDFQERFRRLRLSKLTVEGVYEGCRRLLQDPRYKNAALKLQALGTGPGTGREHACDLIEHAGRHGLRYLTESDERGAIHASRLTGHCPLVITLAKLAFAGGAMTVILSQANSFGVCRKFW